MRGPELKLLDAVRRRRNAFFNNTFVVKHPIARGVMLVYLYQTYLGFVTADGEFVEAQDIPAPLRTRLTARRLHALKVAFPERT